MSDSDRRLRGSSGVAAVPHSFTESSSFLRYISSFTGSTVPYYGTVPRSAEIASQHTTVK